MNSLKQRPPYSFLKGTSEIILDMCDRAEPGIAFNGEKIMDMSKRFTDDGLRFRILAMAYKMESEIKILEFALKSILKFLYDPIFYLSDSLPGYIEFCPYIL